MGHTIGNTGWVTYTNTAPKKKSGLWWKILGGIVAVILILLLLAEFGLRWYVKDNITNTLKEQAVSSGVQLREDPEVTLGTTPMLFGMAQGKIPELNMTIPSTLQVRYENNDESRPVVEGNPEVKMSAKDIRMNGSSQEDMVMDSLDVETLMPTDAMLAQAQATMNESKGEAAGLEGMLSELLRVTDITANEADQTLVFQLGGGLADLVLKPEVAGGELSMQAEDVRLLGYSLPAGITDALGEQLAGQAAEAGRAMGDMEMTGVEVHSDGLRVKMHGNDVSMKEMAKSVEDSGALEQDKQGEQSKPGELGTQEEVQPVPEEQSAIGSSE